LTSALEWREGSA